MGADKSNKSWLKPAEFFRFEVESFCKNDPSEKTTVDFRDGSGIAIGCAGVCSEKI